MTFTCDRQTSNGYEINVQFWTGSKIKNAWPFEDAEAMKANWQEDYEPKLKTSLLAISQYVIDFGLPSVGVLIDDEMGWNTVISVSVSPLTSKESKKNIEIAVYSEF